MVSGANAHVAVVEYLGHIVGMDVTEGEGNGPAAALEVVRAEDRHAVAVSVPEGAERVSGQLLFVLPHGLHAERLEIVDRGTQPDRLRDRRSPRFELPRRNVRGEAVETHVANHFSATHEW